jgi:hypothetical protein
MIIYRYDSFLDGTERIEIHADKTVWARSKTGKMTKLKMSIKKCEKFSKDSNGWKKYRMEKI